MAEVVNYATKYETSLSNALPHVLHFGALYSTPNNGRFKWLNASSIQIPSIKTSGRKAGSRDAIQSPSRNWDNAWETKTLKNERYWDTLVHPMDIDQTNMVASIGNITKTYNESQKFPEMDAYTISKLFELAKAQSSTVDETVLTVDNILTVYDKLSQEMDEALVPPTGRILYVTPEVDGLLKNASKIVRNIDVTGNNGMLSRVVSALDQVKIEVVPAVLMKTVYDFTEGWAPGTATQQINMVLIHPSAVITPIKYTFSALDAPSALTGGKYYYYEESFEDVFILNNWSKAIAFNVTAAA